MRNETRFRMVEKLDPERFKRLLMSAEKQARQRVAIYKQLSGLTVPQISDAEIEAPVPAGAKN
jgi:pyruvate-ferredoxin/flavodoxin oxidoreductase